MRFFIILCILLLIKTTHVFAQQVSPRDMGIILGVMNTGRYNAITDVAGVSVGQVTLNEGDSIRTGVTSILPHQGNVFQQKVPAAIYLENGFGKLMGYSQVKELGNIETPIILTNTLSVPTAANALINYVLSQKENQQVRSVNPVVGETNDGYLNDIRGQHVTQEHVLQAIREATTGKVAQGNVGAGTGTVCFGYKGGIGTSSRVLPKTMGGYTVGVLVQTNYGGILQLAGLPLGQMLDPEIKKRYQQDADGSCMVIIATDAPLDGRNLERIAKRAALALGQTGGITSNGSGEYMIAFSTDTAMRIPYESALLTEPYKTVQNDHMTSLFLAVIEATREAVYNSLFYAETMTGREGHQVKSLPLDTVKLLLNKHQLLQK